MHHNQPIIFQEKPARDGRLGEIILNRPKALNALTLEMCQDLTRQLAQWATADSIKAVIIKGSGERAFCAGGDIRLLYENRHTDPEHLAQFFWHEYRLNAAIHHFPKPYISLLNGVTMGGGAGISIHGSHRIASEHLQFAMPETKIGFYPDIGASYFLNRCPGKTGHYLGLTGNTIDHTQAQALGLIHYIVRKEQWPALEQALTEAPIEGDLFQSVTRIIKPFSIAPEAAELDPYYDVINTCFNQDSMEHIISALQQTAQPWCQHIAEALLERSPTSLKVTFERLNRAAQTNFDAIMQMDLNVTKQFLRNPDFFEGVRAAVIDKDQSPQWNPKHLSDVNNSDVAAYFSGAATRP